MLRLGQATHVKGVSLTGAFEIAVLYESNQLQQLGIAEVAKHGGAFQGLPGLNGAAGARLQLPSCLDLQQVADMLTNLARLSPECWVLRDLYTVIGFQILKIQFFYLLDLNLQRLQSPGTLLDIPTQS